jgi:hypothetical protein
MGAFVKRYTKSPDEERLFVVPFATFLASLGAGVTVSAVGFDSDDGVTVENTPALVGTDVALLIGGGDSGRFYTAYATLTTSDGQVKRNDIQIRVRGGGIAETVYDDGGPANFDDDYDDFDEGGV